MVWGLLGVSVIVVWWLDVRLSDCYACIAVGLGVVVLGCAHYGDFSNREWCVGFHVYCCAVECWGPC